MFSPSSPRAAAAAAAAAELNESQSPVLPDGALARSLSLSNYETRAGTPFDFAVVAVRELTAAWVRLNLQSRDGGMAKVVVEGEGERRVIGCVV